MGITSPTPLNEESMVREFHNEPIMSHRYPRHHKHPNPAKIYIEARREPYMFQGNFILYVLMFVLIICLLIVILTEYDNYNYEERIREYYKLPEAPAPGSQ